MPATPKRQGRQAKPGAIFLSDALASNVREMRSRRRWSQDALAERMRWLGHDWSRATLSDVERSGRTVTLDEFFALATALGVPPAELLNPHGRRVDLGSAANPVHPAFIGHWLAGRVRVEVDPEGDHSSFLVQFPQPETPSKPATMRELHEFLSGAGAEDRQ